MLNLVVIVVTVDMWTKRENSQFCLAQPEKTPYLAVSRYGNDVRVCG